MGKVQDMSQGPRWKLGSCAWGLESILGLKEKGVQASRLAAQDCCWHTALPLGQEQPVVVGRVGAAAHCEQGPLTLPWGSLLSPRSAQSHLLQ